MQNLLIIEDRRWSASVRTRCSAPTQPTALHAWPLSRSPPMSSRTKSRQSN